MAKDLSGSTLGKYQITTRLGRGGMADVYRAYQPGMDRYVAIKVMHGHLSDDPNFITRFQREAQSVGNLRHPNIVQVIDFDVQEGEYYMVMEFIQGDTLKAMLNQRGTLPVEEALNIAGRLADALAYAHSQGMVHRDIKPANVLFTKAGSPVLTDFGIARLLDSSGLTSSGVMIGTPAYMSPEAGRGEKADERSDIYSLGVVLYEMLTGTVPYDADTPYAVILKHINDPLPMPRQFNQALPESVERVVLKALSKNPNDRFQSAAEMRSALEKAKETLATERPTETGMPTPPPVAAEPTVIGPGTPPRANLLPLIAAGVALLLIIGAIALLTRPQSVPPDRSPAAPTAVAVIATTAATVAPTPTIPATVSIPATAIPATASIPPTATTTATSVPLLQIEITGTTDDIFSTTAPTSGNNASADPAFVAQIKQLIDDGSAKVALEKLGLALKANPQSYDLLTLRAWAEITSGDETLANQALADAEAAAKIDPKRPEAYFALGGYYQFAFRPANDADLVPGWKKSVSYYTQAIDLKVDDYRAYLNRAMMNAKVNDYVGMDNNVPSKVIEDDFVKALSYSPQNADAYLEAGQYFFFQKKYDQAQPYLEQTLVLYPPSVYGAAYLASIHLIRGQTDKAFQVYSNGIVKVKVHDPKYLADGAYVAWAHGNKAAAKEWANLALSLEPNTPAASYVLALLAWDNKHYDDALKLLADLARQDRNTYNDPFLNRGFNRDVNVDRAAIYVAMGKPDDAIAAYEEAKKVDDSWLLIWIEQSKLYLQQGKIEEARANLRHSMDLAVSQNDDKAQEDIVALLKQLPGPAAATPSPTPS